MKKNEFAVGKTVVCTKDVHTKQGAIIPKGTTFEIVKINRSSDPNPHLNVVGFKLEITDCDDKHHQHCFLNVPADNEEKMGVFETVSTDAGGYV